MTRTVNVLASDFEGNRFMNTERGLDGCPLERAFTRAGSEKWYGLIMDAYHPAETKVLNMFHKIIPTEDFSFEIDF